MVVVVYEVVGQLGGWAGTRACPRAGTHNPMQLVWWSLVMREMVGWSLVRWVVAVRLVRHKGSSPWGPGPGAPWGPGVPDPLVPGHISEITWTQVKGD